jgi:hypothetical protein
MNKRYYAHKPNFRDRLLLDGEFVAEFLNRDNGTAKVLSLVKEYGTLQGSLPKIVSRGSSVRVVSGPYEGRFMYRLDTKESARAVRRINRLLAGYHFRRSVSGAVFIQRGEAPRIETFAGAYRDTPRFNEEYAAVESVIELATAGEIARLKQCPPGCGRWFMAAPRPDRKHCSDDCKMKRWRETHRKEWAEYMRKHRLTSGKHGK